MPVLTNQGIELYYETWGEKGDWLTLVNGSSRTLNDFRAMAKALSPTFRILSLDNRGAGRSYAPSAFTLLDAARDVLALWNHLGIETSHLLGMSYGGAVSLAAAEMAAPRIQSLVLASTAASSTWIENLEGSRPFENYFSDRFLKKSPVLARALIAELGKTFLDQSKSEQADKQKRALAYYDFRSLIPNLDFPILVLHGEADRIISPGAAKEVAALAKLPTLEIFPEMGHLFLVEMPKVFYSRVGAFLTSNFRRRS